MLVEIADDVFVWSGAGRLDAPNAGVVVEDDGITVIDSLLVASQAAELAAALERFVRPVRLRSPGSPERPAKETNEMVHG